MATYWVPDLPKITGISGHLWCSILICANDASHARFSKHIKMLARLWPHLMFCELKNPYILESIELGLEKSELPWTHNFIAVSVFPVELLAYQVSMVYAAN